ncbi:squamosa promoter-binding-like protein 3 [Glycine max]|uniref:SBP-type domain-containing protein n=1 Tax=Glycine max TaxID=3847 RepID=I1M3R4_SOYBN|nr:squamosa promoter-binding-like protein 3 [Glycine max]|eukprot:XP_006595445.1 squamosa promoter-binding-like protein 3 [Glycine max]
MVVRSDRLKRDVADCGDNNQNGYVEQEKKIKGVHICGVVNADLHEAKQYHRRHRVCEYHVKAQVVLVDEVRQRFCQQCSRFHELAEFDDTKRSCRSSLAGHNERRRKNSDQSQAEGSSRNKGTGHPQLKDITCGQADERGRIQITIHENAAYKHFQIR